MDVRRRLFPRIKSIHALFCATSRRPSRTSFSSASHLPSDTCSLGRSRCRDAMASSSRSFESSQRGEFGMKMVHTMINLKQDDVSDNYSKLRGNAFTYTRGILAEFLLLSSNLLRLTQSRKPCWHHWQRDRLLQGKAARRPRQDRGMTLEQSPIDMFCRKIIVLASE